MNPQYKIQTPFVRKKENSTNPLAAAEYMQESVNYSTFKGAPNL